MKTEIFLISWTGADRQEINAQNSSELRIVNGHTCKACVSPKNFVVLNEFVSHLEDAHALTLKRYLKSFGIRPRHAFNVRAPMKFQFIRFRHQRVAKKKVVTSVKKNPIFRIGDTNEMVKRIAIEGVETYQRMPRKSTTGKKVLAGGLLPEDLEHIPEVDETFVLNEMFHQATVAFLSRFGFNSLLLTGDTGTGKTSAVLQIAANMRQPVLRFNMTGSTKVEHLLQEQVVDTKKKEIRYEDRDLLIAWKKGYWLLVDEASAASPQVMFLFFRLLEENPTLKTFDGKVLKPHPHFKFIFTDNRIGNPNYFKYHGTQQQNAAFISRIATTIVYGSLSQENEKRVLKRKFGKVDGEFVTKLVKFADEIRGTVDSGNFSEPFSIRDLEHIVENYIIYNDARPALEYGYLNKLQEKSDKQFIEGVWQRHFISAVPTTT